MVGLIAHTSIPGTGGGPGPFTSSAIDTTGSTLLVVVVANSYLFNPVISDNKGNTWHGACLLGDVSNNSQLTISYAWNPTVGSGHTFTISGGLNFISAEVASFSGIKTSADPLDHTNTGRAGSVGSVQPGSITPSTDLSLVIAGLATSGAVGFTASIDSGFSITDQLPLSSGEYYGSALAWLGQVAAAAINPTWTESGGSHDLTAGIASFLPAPPVPVSVAITESADSVAGTLFANAFIASAITESPDSITASLHSTFNVAISITEAPDIVDVEMLANALLTITVTESPDSVFAPFGFDIVINIGSEEADSIAMVLGNVGSWNNCSDQSTDWTDCPDPATTWTQCPDPSTDWTLN